MPATAGLLSISLASGSLRPFVVAAYDDDGLLVEVPLTCPWSSPDVPCDVAVQGRRSRKTGPSHPLVVCRCRVHPVAFTVYPPGLVPYARRMLLGAAEPGRPPTYEQIARDAADGTPWARASPGGSDRWWSTQLRALERIAEATGIAALPDTRDAIAVATGLPVGLLAQGARAVGYRGRGRAVVDVLEALGDTSDPLDHLLLAGALAGCWGQPWRWDLEPQRLRALVPLELHAPPIRSTTSGPRGPPVDV